LKLFEPLAEAAAASAAAADQIVEPLHKILRPAAAAQHVRQAALLSCLQLAQRARRIAQDVGQIGVDLRARPFSFGENRNAKRSAVRAAPLRNVLTVPDEMPMTSAVSSIDRPEKYRSSTI